MSIHKLLTEQELVQRKKEYHSELRSSRRAFELNKKRSFVIEQSPAIVIETPTIESLIDELQTTTNTETIKEKLLFLRHSINSLKQSKPIVNDNLIPILLQLLKQNELSIILTSLSVIVDLVCSSSLYSKQIQKYNGFAIFEECLQFKELLSATLWVLGNIVFDGLQEPFNLINNAAQKVIQFNDIDCVRVYSWALCNCASVGFDVKGFIPNLIVINDIEIQKQMLMTSTFTIENNNQIPIQNIISFLHHSSLRSLALKVLAQASYGNHYIMEIIQNLVVITKLPLEVEEIVDFIWMCENIVINGIEFLRELIQLGIIQFIIKKAYVMHIPIKRECCYTLSTCIKISKTCLVELKQLVGLGITEVFIEILQNRDLLLKDDILVVLESVLVLLNNEQYGVGAGEILEQHVDLFQKILMDKTSPTTICKKVQWLLDLYFE
ncbi:IBB domain-containing protein [Entamoeba marina]